MRGGAAQDSAWAANKEPTCVTWPHPMLWTSLPGQGGWWQCLQPLPAAGIYSDAAYRDAGKGASFLAGIWNHPGVSFSLAAAQLLQSITRGTVMHIHLWRWDFFRGGVLAALRPQRRAFMADRSAVKQPQPHVSRTAPAALASSSWRGLLLGKKRPLLVTFPPLLQISSSPAGWYLWPAEPDRDAGDKEMGFPGNTPS